jgi:hypothetical protein
MGQVIGHAQVNSLHWISTVRTICKFLARSQQYQQNADRASVWNRHWKKNDKGDLVLLLPICEDIALAVYKSEHYNKMICR